MEKSIKCVLLIDDDKATNFFNQRVVSKHQCYDQVYTVQSGAAALNYLKEANSNKAAKPDLIFLDINMPAMNGWEFLTEYAKLNASFTEGIKVILLSTSSHLDDISKSMQNHKVVDFINKPLSLPVLDKVLQSHFL